MQTSYPVGPDNSLGARDELTTKLLKLGGRHVVFSGLRPVFRKHEPAVWYGADHMEPGAPASALLNVASRYAQSKDIHIGVGYALDEDGVWQEHAWGLRGPYVLETTRSRRIYWGVRLTGLEARNFCYEVGVACC